MEKPKHISAIIFDMDGVIIDAEKHWAPMEIDFLQQYIPDFDETDREMIVGCSLQDIYDRLCSDYDLDVDWDDFAQAYDEMALEIYESIAEPVSGALDMIADINERGIPLALASSSNRSWIDIVLHRFDLETVFDYTVSAQEIDGPSKPEPLIYETVASGLGVSPSECVVIEDSMNGTIAAVEAGMYCIGLRNGSNDAQDLSAAQLEITGFEEFPRELLQS